MLGENEREVKIDEFRHWASLDVTTEFRKRLLRLFDHHEAILGNAATFDQLKGRAEVLDFVINPHRLFDVDT